jgi:hypothetical protein
MTRVRATAILALLSAFGLSSCVGFVWSRDRTFERPAKGALDGLEAGRTTLTECLSRLGAPLFVWEYKGNGAALAWGYRDKDSKKISVTVPLEKVHPTFSYSDISAKLYGPVLFFDDKLVLEMVKEGHLRDLKPGTKPVRPAAEPSGEVDQGP